MLIDMHSLPGGAQKMVPYGGVVYPDSQFWCEPIHAMTMQAITVHLGSQFWCEPVQAMTMWAKTAHPDPQF